MKLGLYSITYLGVWYRGEALTLEEVIGRAREYGYDGIEIDGKRPHGNPLDLPAARCRDISRRAADGGVPTSTPWPPTTTSATRSPKVREAQIGYVRELIRMTADLGAPVLRVFLAWWGVTLAPATAPPTTSPGGSGRSSMHEVGRPSEIWGWCRDGLVEAARCAGDAGVTLALQNHQPLIKDHHDMLRMVCRGRFAAR